MRLEMVGPFPRSPALLLRFPPALWTWQHLPRRGYPTFSMKSSLHTAPSPMSPLISLSWIYIFSFPKHFSLWVVELQRKQAADLKWVLCQSWSLYRKRMAPWNLEQGHLSLSFCSDRTVVASDRDCQEGHSGERDWGAVCSEDPTRLAKLPPSRIYTVHVLNHPRLYWAFLFSWWHSLSSWQAWQ